MTLEKRKITGREKDEASIRLLEKLRQKLHSGNISTARRAAFSLAWMQEDGLGILKEALFGGFPKSTKSAAAYGLRNMQGRMRKIAVALFHQGKKYRNRDTSAVCEKALLLLEAKASGRPIVTQRPRRPDSPRVGIREISHRSVRERVDRNVKGRF